jgi:hypothetical protein
MSHNEYFANKGNWCGTGSGEADGRRLRLCCEDPVDRGAKALFVNTPRAIGKPVTVERLTRYKAALSGDDKPFRSKDTGPAKVLSHMINTTSRLCHV